MEDILPYLMLDKSKPMSWPDVAWETLDNMLGDSLDSGNSEDLLNVIDDLRYTLDFPYDLKSDTSLSDSDRSGFALFFDQWMSKKESSNWFNVVIPKLAKLLLKLPSLLEAHYQNPNMDIGATTALRILQPQESGVVFLSQELIAALLTCSLICLVPDNERSKKNLPMINFNQLVAALYDASQNKRKILNKIWCIIAYFDKINFDKPKGIVSFERRALSKIPDAEFWSKSTNLLCEFKVDTSGLIEDHSSKAVEVYFVGKNLWENAALGMGISQEEIRFMLSPELIAGMLFLPAMEDNEAIEIVGVERFSTYEGYRSSFRFAKPYVDETGRDNIGRLKTRIVAVNELCTPKNGEYTEDIYLREVNKAFCGFQCKHQSDNIGVATGDWECDSSGKDPEMKAIIKLLAASQARRPFIAYCTFGLEAFHNLGEVGCWISSQRWTVGDLWNKLIEYSTNGSPGGTNVGFFQWLQQGQGLRREMN